MILKEDYNINISEKKIYYNNEECKFVKDDRNDDFQIEEDSIIMKIKKNYIYIFISVY